MELGQSSQGYNTVRLREFVKVKDIGEGRRSNFSDIQLPNKERSEHI
jgi:hypothetical protein